MTEKAVLAENYANTDNLTLRKNFHEKYSTNKEGYQKWMFKHYPFKEGIKVLELGSGSGALWEFYNERDDLKKLKMEIVLSDFSEGMVEHLEKTYTSPEFTVKKIDACDIPYEDGTFDIVIANAMLYHVEDIDKALSEIRRVLKQGGNFYCSTFGENGMTGFLDKALHEIGLAGESDENISFTLQNGGAHLMRHFMKVQRKDYKDCLKVDKLDDYMAYIYSMASMNGLRKEDYADLYAYFKSKMRFGFLKIPKEYGMFLAR